MKFNDIECNLYMIEDEDQNEKGDEEEDGALDGSVF